MAVSHSEALSPPPNRCLSMGFWFHFDFSGFDAILCPESSGDHLDFLGGRFRVEAQRDNPPNGGMGEAFPLTDISGGFLFSGFDNLDTTVLVLNGCNINDHFWVFTAGTTNAEAHSVRNRYSDQSAEGNFHPLGTPFPNALDTEAFAGCR